MTEAEFNRLAAAGYNRIPLVLETFADLDTPLSVYLKLANRPYTYLLESVVGGERFGRYSFIGLPARNRIEVFANRCIEYRGDRKLHDAEVVDPLDFVNACCARYRAAPVAELPRFCGGLVGYFGYDTVRYIERRLTAGFAKPDPLGTPDIMLLESDQLAVVDNLAGKLFLVVYADPREPGAYHGAQERLKELLTDLRKPVEIPHETPVAPADSRSEVDENAYCGLVERAKRYIYDGDMMQVQIGNRVAQPLRASPLALYRALRSVNPSPYMYFFNLDGFHVVGASPEILVRQEAVANGTKITIRPLAGTRRRGTTPEEDQALAAELLADPKERAEHVMLIDLARNDVGRIAETGSVKVTDEMVIERYSHVMHIVSNVEAQLRPGMSNLDVLRATFPAGTLTGAPKVRAMEIIDELEATKRGIYGGAVGYLGFHGDMDLAIAIRTAIVKDGTLYVQSAAGIVADSVPQSEWQETRNKARAVLRAAEIAERGLDSRVE
ncbi:MAG TPA: anthranilate synthase component I [Burkholderiales bacterium]|nr:anthranilate synthase component I [Burkholderiales bacterium]